MVIKMREKILAEHSEEEIKRLQQERCIHCKNWKHDWERNQDECRYGLLPFTSSGDFCEQYMV